MSTSAEATRLNERILSVLPLFYVGWSDSVLSPSEMKLIRKVVSDMDFLTKEDKDYLNQWTNPTEPPTEEIFKQWLQAIKNSAKDLADDEKKSLVSVGMKIGKIGIGSDQESIAALKALQTLEEVLAIDNPMSASLRLNQISEEPGLTCHFDSEAMTAFMDGEQAE